MRHSKLTRQEKAIEDGLLRGEYIDVNKSEFDAIAQSIALRKKDAVLNIRMNSQDLAAIKQKARQLGVKYQTFITEILHKVAQAH